VVTFPEIDAFMNDRRKAEYEVAPSPHVSLRSPPNAWLVRGEVL
jgi:hypothetical protein